ncbi:MAG: hypothetical protein NZ993_01090 [Bacteroidetes bacterium]|nr:hypothetical protein [Bacteroidota bacterium]
MRLLALWIALSDSGLVPSDRWLQDLVARYASDYWRAHRALLVRLAERHALNADDPDVRHRLVVAHLLHQFVAAHRRPWGGGLLGVRYAYMDERAQILRRLDTPTGPVYEPLYVRFRRGHRYVQRAHAVDRVPRLFLGDLFAESPPYRWAGQPLYSFGWCSELEMAYVTLLGYFRIPARIVMPRPTHVRTQLWVAPNRSLLVDNTEGWFGEQPWPYAEDAAPGVPEEARRYLAWYQARAREGAVVPVGPRARARVEAALLAYLEQRRLRWDLPQQEDSRRSAPIWAWLAGGGVALLLLWGLIWAYSRWYRRRTHPEGDRTWFG